MKDKSNNLMIINTVLVILIIIIILDLLYIKVNKTDTFNNLATQPNTSIITNPLTTKPPEPIDRTKLYGSLSLRPNYFQTTDDVTNTMDNKLDNSIINMTNPSIQYEDKRIQLNNYIDILI